MRAVQNLSPFQTFYSPLEVGMHCLGRFVHSKTELRIESAHNQWGHREDWLLSRTAALNQNSNVDDAALPTLQLANLW